jgi:hypothetical protein
MKSKKISRILESIPEAMNPLYEVDSSNQIDLYKGRATLDLGFDRLDGNVRIWFSLSNYSSLRFKFNPNNNLRGLVETMASSSSFVVLTLDGNSALKCRVENRGFVSGIRENTEITIEGSIIDRSFVGDGSHLKELTLHLFNFPYFLGERIRHSSSISRSRLDLIIGDWEIIIDGIEGLDRNFKKFNNDSISFISHVGRIRKKTGTTFSYVEAEALIETIETTFSFVESRFIRFGLVKGENIEDKKFYDWTPSFIPSNYAGRFILNHFVDPPLNELLVLVHLLGSSAVWKEEVKRLVHWFCEASAPSVAVESKVVLIHTALELISWVYFVEDKKIHSKRKFNKIPVSAQVELLLKKMKCGLDVPDNLANMEELRERMNKRSAPECFSLLRNSIVHPSRKEKFRKMDSNEVLEVLRWGFWALELSILYVIGYNGTYGNRLKAPLWRGQVEDVPWRNYENGKVKK